MYNHQPTVDSSCLNAPTFGPNHCGEPAILRSEIVAAVKKLKAGKAPGIDEIPGELKHGGDCIIGQLHHICNDISGVARAFPGGRLAHPENQNEEKNK